MNIASLFQGLATLAWIATVAIIVFAVIRSSQNRPLRRGLSTILILVAVAVLLTVIASGLVFINPQERGVVISAVSPQGYRPEPLSSGIHWIFPFVESVERYQISRQTYTMSIADFEGDIQGDDSITARTADGQEVFVDASVIYSIDPARVVDVHINWQERYSDDLVRPQARGVIRDVVSQYGVEEVISSQRVEMVNQINDALREKLSENGIMLVDFVLRNITFSPEYAASVEQKQIAEQLAQQARFTVQQRKEEAEQARQVAQGQADASVIRAQGDAEARIIEAQAEAEALRLIAEALNGNPDLLTYQYISKLAPNIQAMLLPSGNPFIFSLDQVGPQPLATPVPTAQPTVPPTTTTP